MHNNAFALEWCWPLTATDCEFSSVRELFGQVMMPETRTTMPMRNHHQREHVSRRRTVSATRQYVLADREFFGCDYLK
jgi:hypothetical protein